MKPVRLLLGRTDEIQESSFWSFGDREKETLAQEGIHVLTFSSQNADIIVNVLEQDYSYLESQLNQLNFQPDLAIIVTGGYGFLPEGLEKAPFPLALLNIEWFFTTQHFTYQAKRVDFLYAVLKTTLPYFQRLTGKKAYATSLPLLGDHFPSFTPLPDTPKIYDVTYVGTCNPSIHPDRTKFLARLASLPEKYNILIGQTIPKNGNTFQFDNTNLINNQTKICINSSHPLVHAVGTRIAHTMFSQSFMLADHLVDEKDLLEEGVHCDFYTDENLEEKIAYYLSHEPKRENIAKRGHDYAKNGAFAFTATLKKMIEQLGEPPFEKLKTAQSFFKRSPAEQQNALGVELLLSGFISSIAGFKKGLNYIQNALDLEPENPEFLNNAATSNAFLLLCYPQLSPLNPKELEQKTITLFKKAQASHPNDIFSRFNEAYLYRHLRYWNEYVRVFMEINELIENKEIPLTSLFPYIGIAVAPLFDLGAKRRWQETFFEHFGDGAPTKAFFEQLKRLILWYINVWMADFQVERNQHTSAVEHYELASSFLSTSETYEALGKNLVILGKLDLATTCFEKSLELNRLNIQVARHLCELLQRQKQNSLAKKLAKQYTLICKRIPVFEQATPFFEAIEKQEKEIVIT